MQWLLKHVEDFTSTPLRICNADVATARARAPRPEPHHWKQWKCSMIVWGNSPSPLGDHGLKAVTLYSALNGAGYRVFQIHVKNIVLFGGATVGGLIPFGSVKHHFQFVE